MSKILPAFFLLLFTCLGFFTNYEHAKAHDDNVPVVHLFGREDCHFCQDEKEFLDQAEVSYVFLDVVNDKRAVALFDKIIKKHDLSKVTPITVVGTEVFQGFNGEKTTGQAILDAIPKAKEEHVLTIEDHLLKADSTTVTVGDGCDEDGIECDGTGTEYVFDLPLLGLVDLKTFSLFTLSATLGVIDGFNPCAMWVLITFLLLLSQAGSKKKMIFLAGVFIMAEAIMYNLILNVWYKTWDFVSLDQVVTPLVGALSLAGGAFFLYRWHKNRNLALVCDISSLDSQAKMTERFRSVISQPLTLTTIIIIITIAFSVNIIEFACSIGIPQAYTKILELNDLNFLLRQLYILVYTIGYMVDDIIVFGLAVWGYSKLEAHGQKYSQLSLLIGGLLMLLLGTLLVFIPSALVL